MDKPSKNELSKPCSENEGPVNEKASNKISAKAVRRLLKKDLCYHCKKYSKQHFYVKDGEDKGSCVCFDCFSHRDSIYERDKPVF